jgi:succinoglycan biosynthesis protein ExoM
LRNYFTSVVIPTYRRPEGLAKAIESVLAQDTLDAQEIELLVVDNDPDGSARDVVNRFGNAQIEVRYAHEPEPGVANARNTAVAAAKGKLIAFLDDDQTAPPHWLNHLLRQYDVFKAAVTFGPVDTVLPEEGLPHSDYLKAFFARTGPEKSGLLDEFYGCGNSLLDMEQMPKDGPLFDKKANETGGEDDYLFSRVEMAGGKFAWAADAEVFEHVPASRAHLKYTLRRSFGYGQGPTAICAHKKPVNYSGVAFWMVVGLGQTIVYGAIASVMFATRSKRRAFWYDRTSQGLGKLLWFSPFEQRFYGRHAV